MTDAEKMIIEEIRGLRTDFKDGLTRAHERIDSTNEEVSEVKEMALVSKTKMGTFVAGMVFVFTGLFGIASHIVKAKFLE